MAESSQPNNRIIDNMIICFAFQIEEIIWLILSYDKKQNYYVDQFELLDYDFIPYVNVL